MNDIQASLFEAMDSCVVSAIQRAEADITVEGEIIEVIDAGTQEYSIKYSESTFSAIASSSSNIKYSVGDIVYILIPKGDFSNNKIILSLVNPRTEVFVDEDDTNSDYFDVSDNLIDKNLGMIELSSYGTTREEYEISEYSPNKFTQIFVEYFKKYRAFSLNCLIKTSIIADQQSSGNYGITLNLPLIADAGGGEKDRVWRTYSLDINNLEGNPYRLLDWSPQSLLIEIDENYTYDNTVNEETGQVDRVPFLSIFCKDFSEQDEQKAETIKDIFIKDISLTSISAVGEGDKTGYTVTLKASQGEYFSNDSDDTKIITPTLRVNGKITSLNKYQIYWFIEDAEIKPGNKYYTSIGGHGWKCLNAKTNISLDSSGVENFEYITNIAELNVTRDDVKYAARYKCVLVDKTPKAESIIELRNTDAEQFFELKSLSNSNNFIKDIGYVNLIATVYIKDITDKEENRNSILYSWTKYDQNNVFQNNFENIFETVYYNKIVEKEVSGELVSCFETQIRFPVSGIENFNTVYCSAKLIKLNELGTPIEELIGTCDILIYTSMDFQYDLIIKNADKIYKYDRNGNSPFSEYYKNSFEYNNKFILPLEFDIFKNNGRELTNEEYKFVKYSWFIPEDSLFVIDKSIISDIKNGYIIVSGYDTVYHDTKLFYDIDDRYDINKINSRIILKVEFNGVKLEKEVPINFVKEFTGGANGAFYTATLMSDNESLNFVYNIYNRVLYLQNKEENILIPWDRSKKINSFVHRNNRLITDYNIEFSMFDEQETNPCFKVIYNKGEKSCSLDIKENVNINIDEKYCNIIQAKIIVEEQTLYCYYPIELTLINTRPDESNGVLPFIDGGYAEVVYTQDGAKPTWDGTSAFICKDIKVDEEDLSKYYTINWSTSNQLSIVDNNDNLEIKNILPCDKYNNGKSKNYVSTILEFNKNKKDEIEGGIKFCTEEISKLNKLIGEDERNLGFLEEFAKKLNLSLWKQELRKLSPLFSCQTNILNSLNILLGKVKNFITYIDSRKILNMSSYNLIKIKITDLEEKIKLGIEQIKILDGSENKDFVDLVSLEEYLTIWTDEFKDLCLSAFGEEYMFINQTYIQEIESLVSSHQMAYRLIMEMPDKEEYASNYKALKEEIYNIGNFIPEDAYSDVLYIKQTYSNYLVYFEENVSYESRINCLNKIRDNIAQVILEFNSSSGDYTNNLNNRIRIEYHERKNIKEIEKLSLERRIDNFMKFLRDENKKIVHIKPIILHFNRDGMSNISSWDGNKIRVNENSYLIPTAGSGFEEENGSFTGVVFGTKNSNDSSNENQSGIFGYSSGNQSLKLDAKTGTSVFGSAREGGQIVVDQSKGTTGARIYSNNYWKEYDHNQGTPIDYTSSNKANKGMLINLKDSCIHFGENESGKFYSGNHGDLESQEPGFYMSQNGLSIGSNFRVDGYTNPEVGGINIGSDGIIVRNEEGQSEVVQIISDITNISATQDPGSSVLKIEISYKTRSLDFTDGIMTNITDEEAHKKTFSYNI